MLLHRFIVYLVCVSVAATCVLPGTGYAGVGNSAVMMEMNEQVLLNDYPQAKILHVTTDNYPALEERLKQMGYQKSKPVALDLAQSDTRYIKQSPSEDNRPVETSTSDDCGQGGITSSSEESFRVIVDLTDDIMDSGNNASGDEAVVVFVIIGAVVLVVWTLYVFKYFYDVSVGIVPCGRWSELTMITSGTSNDGDQHARFNGLRYSTGFRNGVADVGISLEAGQIDLLLREVTSLELEGQYWLLGPVLRWRLLDEANPSYLEMNFLAGSTEHDEVGLLARANIGVLIGIGKALQLGLNWGVMNINLNGDQGIISDRSQYHYLYGINIGFRF